MASKFQRGYDEKKFETIVNRNFYCLLCFNVLREPVMCRNNQHFFCRGCITEHLNANSHTCPTCADELSVETLCDVPRIVKDYLDELRIRCDYYDRGCQELVQLQNLEQHVAECGFTPVVCGNQGCSETISKRDRMFHESEVCEFRKLKCHKCEEISTKMAAMDTKLLSMETKMEIMSTKIANTEDNLMDVNTKIANVETSIITNMDRKLKHADMKLINTETSLVNMDAKIANFETDVKANFKALTYEVKETKMSSSEVKDGFNHFREAVLDKMESKERIQEEMARDGRSTASGGVEKQHVFVAGGLGKNSVEILNYRRKVWSLLKPMPEIERWGTVSFVYNHHVTVAGGFCSDFLDNMIEMSIQPIPDLATNWSDFGAKLPARMSEHSSVLYSDSLIITGGYDADQDVNSNCISEVQLEPPYTVKLLSKMPEPRVYHSTVLCDDSILIFGGTKTWGYEDNLSSVLSYDLMKNKCQQLPQLPYPVSQMATVKWYENVVIIGGADKNGETLNKVIIYNIKTGNSHMLPPMLHKRKACMAVVIQNTIVVLGGVDERENELKIVEDFTFDRYTWEELPDMKEARSFASAVAI